MAGRGNPNWIRAAQDKKLARARAEEAALQAEQGRVVATMGHAIGAVAGAVAVTVGADRLGLDRQRAAAGAAALGLATAVCSKGWLQAIASGVAAASAAIAIAQRFPPPAKTEQPLQPRNDGSLLTREDLQRALAALAAHRAGSPGGASLAPTEEAADLATQTDTSHSETSAPTDVASVEPTPKQRAVAALERFLDVASRLTDEERLRLSDFVNESSDDTLRTTQEILARTSTEDALERLRSVLRRAKSTWRDSQALTQDLGPIVGSS